MRRRSSTPARAMRACSTGRSSTAMRAMPRRTTSTPCSTKPDEGDERNAGQEAGVFVFQASLSPRSAADIDHVAVAGGGVLVGETGDQAAAVEGDDFAV